MDHDRPVDPGAEITPAFLTWARVRPLLTDARAPVRQFGLELARWELARWSPPLGDLLAVVESTYPEVREFVGKALTADDTPDARRFRVDPARLTADAVYAFCESLQPFARGLGMDLIRRNPRLAIPEELFRLSESPDRHVVAFVVRTIWHLYRDRGITDGWKPAPRPEPKTSGPKPTTAKKEIEPPEGPGAPARPAGLPAPGEALRDFMRRMLFTVPPTKPSAEAKQAAEGAQVAAAQDVPKTRKLRPMPARKAKRALVEAMRDLAEADRGFAALAGPVVVEFMGSRGASERAACMVALARISAAHPDLKLSTEAA